MEDDQEDQKHELSEEEIQQLLDKIRERTSPDSALVLRYRFHALFPEQKIFEEEKFSIKDGYKKLRQHRDFYRYALSMVIFLTENYGSKEELGLLAKHVRSSSVLEADIRKAQLNLWRMLTNIATELSVDEDNVRSLVNMVGVELSINTENIAVGGKFSLAAALKAFQLLEEKGKLQLMLEGHTKECKKFLLQLLKELNKWKLIAKYIEPFNPHQPITLASLNVESESIVQCIAT